MTTLVRRILLALALVGLASSLASLYVHARMLANPGYLSFCDVSATFSCSTVYESRYSMFWRTPVALFGAGYYVVVLLLLLGSVRGPDSLRENAVGHIFALSTVGLGVSLFLAYTSFFVIKAVCMMCLVTYGAVVGLFLVSGARTPYPMTTLPRRAWQDALAIAARPLGLTVVILFVVAAATAVAFVPRDAAPATAQGQGQATQEGLAARQAEFVRFWESQQRVQIPVTSDGAAVVVVRFSDFQCPACGQTHKEYKPVLAKYAALVPGGVKLVTKDFPLERECNAGLARDAHYASCEAAVAARLARGVGRGDAMEDWLYENMAILTPGGVREAARNVGGVTDYDARYAAILEQVKADVGLASVLNIRVTPTFFINGVRLEGGLNAEYFEMALQYELKKAGKMAP